MSEAQEQEGNELTRVVIALEMAQRRPGADPRRLGELLEEASAALGRAIEIRRRIRRR